MVNLLNKLQLIIDRVRKERLEKNIFEATRVINQVYPEEGEKHKAFDKYTECQHEYKKLTGRFYEEPWGN